MTEDSHYSKDGGPPHILVPRIVGNFSGFASGKGVDWGQSTFKVGGTMSVLGEAQ